MRKLNIVPPLAGIGVPIDPNDTQEKMAAYQERYSPAYHLLTDLTPQDRETVIELGKKTLQSTGIPMTFVVDASGAVRLVRWGVPSVSEVRQLLP